MSGQTVQDCIVQFYIKIKKKPGYTHDCLKEWASEGQTGS